MRGVIQKWGNSQAIRLPKTILEMAQFGENESVQIFIEGNKIIIEKDTTFRHKTLKERLAGIDQDYAFEEWDTGAPVGNEVW